MKRICSIFAVVLAVVCAVLPSRAQDTGVNSPLSRYGIGLLSDQTSGFNQGMCGLSYGMHGGTETNYKNPASYSSVDSLTFLFNIGTSLQLGNFTSSEGKYNAKNMTLDYITMSFRLRRGLGMSFGLVPVSNVGYTVSAVGEVFDGGITGNVVPTTVYSGSGGLRTAYVGVGYAPIRPLSFGVNVGFTWGDLTHVSSNNYSDTNVQSLSRVYSADLRTYTLNFGAQYQYRFNNRHSLTLGAVYELGRDISGESYYYNQRVNQTTVVAVDTLTAVNAWSLPQKLGAGVTWQYKGLRVGVDYTMQMWSSCKQPVLQKTPIGFVYQAAEGGYEDSHNLTFGGEYVKDPYGLRWSDRVRYRAGFSYTTGYAKIDGKPAPKSYKASLGVALPIVNLYNNRTFVSVTAQYERVNPQMPGQITENYYRLCLGLNFNERWFQKWRVE